MNKKLEVYVIESENNKELVKLLNNKYLVHLGNPKIMVPKCDVVLVGKVKNIRMRV